MKNSNSKNWPALLLAAFFIPLSPSSQWSTYTFNKIPPNKVEFQQDQLKISVRQSASPFIYSFNESQEVSQVLVEAEIAKLPPDFSAQKPQGSKGADDFILRVGLILKGEDRMSWMQRQMAPDWLVQMEKQLPQKMGVDKVLFFTTCRQKALLNQTRSHYLNSKFQDKCVTLIDKPGPFKIKVAFAKPLKIVGLWVAGDGDDQKSAFDVTIKKIQITDSKKSL